MVSHKVRKQMMYSNKLSACIKVNGKVLREVGDVVALPFGSEYTISIKNHNSRKASVKVEIDSTDVGEGNFIIEPNSTIELKRFIKNNNLNEGNAFKFIERTSSIEDYRGVGQNDGLVRISYEFERESLPKLWQGGWYEERKVCSSPIFPPYHIGSPLRGDSSLMNISSGDIMKGVPPITATYSTTAFNAVAQNQPMFTSSATTSPVESDVGITVPGSVTQQKFQNVVGISTDGVEHVMILHLKGITSKGVPVVSPVTVKIKPKCSTCGKVNKSTSKFCAECGTSLELI